VCTPEANGRLQGDEQKQTTGQHFEGEHDVIKSDETLDLEATTQSKTITSLVRPMALSRATFLATYHRRTGQLCVKRL
jgi:hypothetical protein